MNSITSANAVASLSVAGLFPVPQQLQGFSVERAWESDSVDIAEVQMSVDGRQTSGYTPVSVPQTWSFQADSPSIAIFDAIIAATKAARENFQLSATIDIPSTGQSFIHTNGVLRNVKMLPDAGKVLQARSFTIVWQSIDATIS